MTARTSRIGRRPAETDPAEIIKHPLLYVSEAAILIGISSAKVYDLCRDGRLSVLRLGRPIHIRRESALALLAVPEGGGGE